jgi:hypothetical protein
MTNQHPITPPPDLVLQWREESSTGKLHFSPQYLATQAARWGADQELEACAEWVACDRDTYIDTADRLHAARRPKPPTLKEQALLQLDTLNANLAMHDTGCYLFQMRRALEALPND